MISRPYLLPVYAPGYFRLEDLPRDLGGTAPPMDNTHNVTQLRDYQPFFQNIKKQIIQILDVHEWSIISGWNFECGNEKIFDSLIF